MVIRSATALRNDYDGLVKLSKEKNEPIFITRNGDGEMVFTTIESWEKREAELTLLAEMLRREQNRIAPFPVNDSYWTPWSENLDRNCFVRSSRGLEMTSSGRPSSTI